MAHPKHESLVATGKELVQAAPQLYVDLDVEADGFAGYGSLLSIGAVSPWGETYYQELKPSSDLWVPGNREFCETHNLERERLMDEGVEPAAAMAELADWTNDIRTRYGKQGNAVLTAFNASFDFPHIDLEFRKAGIKSPYGIAGYCIKSLAHALSPQYDWRATAKGNLPSEIIPDGDFTHNALEDAIYQQKLHFALAGKLSER